MTPGKEFSLNHAISTAPNMEIRELIIATALAMEVSKPTSQKRLRRERDQQTPKKIRK